MYYETVLFAYRKNRARATSLEVGSELYRKVLKPLDKVNNVLASLHCVAVL